MLSFEYKGEATALLSSMNSSNTDASGSESSDLKGARVLVVEDTWYLGMALKNQLRSLGAEVVGPCATTAEAERLISEQPADVALVDYNLRGGERADRLIDLLHDRGIRVIVTSGYATL